MKFEPSAKVGGASKMMSRFERNFRGAFGSVDILIVMGTLVVLGVLMLVQLKKPARRPHNVCLRNLKLLGLDMRSWAIDQNGYAFDSSDASTNAFRHFQTIGSAISSPRILVCPEDKIRQTAADFSSGFGNHTLSYFINIMASENDPGGFLAGDRHLSTNNSILSLAQLTLTTNTGVQWTKNFHGGEGNVLLADGSATYYDSRKLRSHVQTLMEQTGRILFP